MSRKRLSDSLDGVLSGRRSARLERHLRDCAACRAYRDGLALLQAGAKDLADPGLSPDEWLDYGRRLESRLAAASSREAGESPAIFFRWKWAWAGASFIVLAFIVTYLAVLRPRAGREAAFLSIEDSVAEVIGEVGSNPDLEESFNREILASIDEAVRPADEEGPVSFGDNPLFWEGLSDGELAYIKSELEKERGHGGLP